MSLVAVAILCAVVFLLCFLVDTLIKKLRRGAEEKTAVVRMPKRGFAFGSILAAFALCAILFWVPREALRLKIGCFAVAAMGIFLMVQYFGFCVRYDERGFAVWRFGRQGTVFSYGEIRAQRSVMTRSGIHTTLMMPSEQIALSSSMDGADDFLRFAFAQWCKQTGTDPESVENNPQMMTYFPDGD